MIVNVYDNEFNLLGVIDCFQSLIWTPMYYDAGDFELYLPASQNTVELLQRERFLVRDCDVSLDSSVHAIYKKVMVVKGIEIKTDAENGDFLTVTGRELKYILHQRIAWNQLNLSGKIEDCVYKLVEDNAILPVDTKRIIPNLALEPAAGFTDTIDKQVTAGEYIDEAITQICASAGYGWEITGYDNVLVFRLYKGVDRSYSQSDRPYVVFSDHLDNLYNTDYQASSENYANAALVAGEGEGVDRTTVTVGGSKDGFERFETFIDAQSLSQNENSESIITEDDYKKYLKQSGKEALAQQSITEAFTGEVLDTAWKYGTDFYLGDIVTVINSYGISKDVQILSAIESVDENGESLIPQFNF